MKPYSLDLRQKILRAYDHQLGSPRALATLFGVSHAFLEQLRRRRRTTGKIAPRPHGGGRQPPCDATARAVVRQRVHEQPDAPLAELWAQLPQRQGLRLRVATMGRVLQRRGLPRKNSPAMPTHATRRGSRRPVPSTASGRPRSRAGA